MDSSQSFLHSILPVFGNDIDERILNIIIHYQQREVNLRRAEEKLMEKKRKSDNQGAEIKIPKTFQTLVDQITKREKDLELRENSIKTEINAYRLKKKEGEVKLHSLLEREKICLLKERILNLVEDKNEKKLGNAEQSHVLHDQEQKKQTQIYVQREQWLEKRDKELKAQNENIRKSIAELTNNVKAIELKENALKEERAQLQSLRASFLEREVDLNIMEEKLPKVRNIFTRERQINDELMKAEDKEIDFKKKNEKYSRLLSIVKMLSDQILKEHPAPARTSSDQDEVLNEGVLGNIDMNTTANSSLRNKKQVKGSNYFEKGNKIMEEKQASLYSNLVLTEATLDEKLKSGFENQYKNGDSSENGKRQQISLEKENLMVYCCGKN